MNETIKIKACGGDRVENLKQIAKELKRMTSNVGEFIPKEGMHKIRGYAEQLLIIADEFSVAGTETGRFSGTQPNESNTPKERLPDTAYCTHCRKECNSDTAEQYNGETVCERCWQDLTSPPIKGKP